MTAHTPSPDATTDDARAGRSRSRRAFLAGTAAATAALAGCVGDTHVVMGKRDESESTYDLSSGNVRIDAEYGEVAVTPATDDVVRVRTEKSGSLRSSLSAVSVSSERDGDTVVVRGTADDGGLLSARPDVSVDVEVPPDVRVESATVGTGGVLVEDVSVHSGARIHARNGGAVARRVDDDVEVTARNGGAVAVDVAGFVTVQARNGGAVTRGCEGVDGASTRNGGVEAEVTAVRGDARLATRNGGVEAALSPDLDARVVASTDRGGVDLSDAPVSTETVTESYVEGTVGDGSHTLHVETTNGGVSLSRLS